MADTFFGLNTSLNRRDNISSPSNDDGPEEQEYDALNDETFGGFEDGSDLDDWEQQHEEFAEFAEHSKQSEEIENSISKLVFDETDVPILSKKDSVWAYTSPTQKNGDIINQSLLQILEKSIESNKSSQSHSSHSAIRHANHNKLSPAHNTNNNNSSSSNNNQHQQQILLSSIKPPNIHHSNSADITVVDGPSSSSTSGGKKWTVEELERDLMMGRGGSGHLVSRAVGTPLIVKQQQVPMQMHLQGVHPMYGGGAGPPGANHLPPGLHPALALRFQQQQQQQHMLHNRGVPPHIAMRMPPPPQQPPHGVPPPGYPMPFNRQPPPPGIGPMSYTASQRPPYPPSAGFPYHHHMPPNHPGNPPIRPPPPPIGTNYNQQHPNMANGPGLMMRQPYPPPNQQQLMMNQQQQQQYQQTGGGAMQQQQLPHRQRRDSSSGRGAGGRTRRESGMDDEYAGLMSNREKQWLLNIQLLQLNTETPFFDDYYYTIFKERKSERSDKQNHQRFNQYNKRENNRNNERQESALTARVYAPQQFENSLGKLQYGSVTAPRKIIDTDLLHAADSETGTTRDLRKTKLLLIELEALYTLLLKAEDLKNPLAMKNVETLRELKQKQRLRELDAAPTPDQKQEVLRLLRAESDPPTESPAIYIARVVHGLLQDDKVNSFFNIRKGKMLLLRLLPHLTPDHFMTQLGDVWSKVLLSIPSIGRRDTAGDNILPQLHPYFKRYVQNCHMSHILEIVSNLVEVVKQEHNNRSTPLSHQGKSPLHFVIGNKFGVSSLVTLLTRTEYLISSSNCTTAQLATWRGFVVTWSDLSAHAPNVATPMDPIPRTVYTKHVQRLVDDDDGDKGASVRATMERYYVEGVGAS